MSNTTNDQFEMSRRSVLQASALGVGALSLGVPMTLSRRVAAATPETYVLSQSGTDHTVSVVTYEDGNGHLVPIEDFYNYASSGNPGGSNSPLGIETNEESRMFLYRDASGLYLVFMHDDYWSAGPNDVKDWQAFFEFSGLPSAGDWVIDEGNDPSDDFGDDDQFYWAWYPRYSDGGAFGVLSCAEGESFDIQVTPDFNPNPDGETFPEKPQSEAWLATDGWKFYNGDGSLITLDPTATLTIGCETCEACTFAGSYKFEYVADEEADLDGFYLDEGAGFTAISYASYESKPDEEFEPISVSFDSDLCADDLVATVKAGRTVYEVDVQEGADGSLVVTVDFEDSPFVNEKNGRLSAISYVEFACA